MTEEMIQEWIETYEEEFKGLQPPPPFSKAEIMTKTEINIETYTNSLTLPLAPLGEGGVKGIPQSAIRIPQLIRGGMK